MQTLTQFIETHSVTMTAKSLGRDTDRGRWEHDKWSCTLRSNGRRTTVTFRMGAGLGGKAPKAADVLDSLASEASSAAESFESWCSELGYDSDSRRAYATYKACRHIAAQLKRLFGDDADTLIYETERL